MIFSEFLRLKNIPLEDSRVPLLRETWDQAVESGRATASSAVEVTRFDHLLTRLEVMMLWLFLFPYLLIEKTMGEHVPPEIRWRRQFKFMAVFPTCILLFLVYSVFVELVAHSWIILSMIIMYVGLLVYFYRSYRWMDARSKREA